MEVKPGYKQTEVGVIPEEWEVRNLSDVSRKITDGDHVTPKRTSQGYYLLSARNVLNGRIDVSDVDYVGTAEYQRMRQRCGPEAGDILISCSGTIGRVAVVPAGFECVLVRSVALAKIDHELADGVFLQFWLQGSKAQWQIASSVNQGAQPNLFLNHIERLVCPRPPRPEQRAIATALSDMDGLLSGMDRLIAKKRDLKQAAMQQLLTGQTRLPGFEGEWREVSLGELGSFLKGRGITRDQSQTGHLPCIRYGEIYTDHDDVIREFRSWISEEVAESAVRIRKGDLLFAGSGETRAEIGKCVALADEIQAYAGGDIVILRPVNAVPIFMGYLLNQPSVNQQKERLGQGDAVVHISANALSKVRISIPNTVEQAAIAAAISDMDADIHLLQQSLNKASALKQGMMQELLTGRTRLI